MADWDKRLAFKEDNGIARYLYIYIPIQFNWKTLIKKKKYANIISTDSWKAIFATFIQNSLELNEH